MTTTKPWDDLWDALEVAGIRCVQGDWGPINADGVNWGERAAFLVAMLRETRLTRHQVFMIAELVRVVAKASSGEWE
jgi:hypothetical protein